MIIAAINPTTVDVFIVPAARQLLAASDALVSSAEGSASSGWADPAGPGGDWLHHQERTPVTQHQHH